ncbi:hypothetical protein J3369_12430 [Alteromonas sp. NFXS44]|uniref:hypothetical protein n=1 Tax=Alteromonas sp. NFXS44 TaxID=2818435 RepID=UPI0032E00F0C
MIVVLLMAFCCQSMASAFDNHEAHQSGTEHLTFEHGHDVDAGNDVSFSQSFDINEDGGAYDCHHCCHCHGGHHVFLPVVLSSLHVDTMKHRARGNPSSAGDGYLSNLLRPPISA